MGLKAVQLEDLVAVEHVVALAAACGRHVFHFFAVTIHPNHAAFHSSFLIVFQEGWLLTVAQSPVSCQGLLTLNQKGSLFVASLAGSILQLREHATHSSSTQGDLWSLSFWSSNGCRSHLGCLLGSEAPPRSSFYHFNIFKLPLLGTLPRSHCF